MQELNVYAFNPAGDLVLSRVEKIPEREPLRMGQIVATPGVLAAVPVRKIQSALSRHSIGDWGVCCPEDWRANNLSRRKGARILSVYEYMAGKDNIIRFWIITEADRSYTTVLLPSEY